MVCNTVLEIPQRMDLQWLHDALCPIEITGKLELGTSAPTISVDLNATNSSEEVMLIILSPQKLLVVEIQTTVPARASIVLSIAPPEDRIFCNAVIRGHKISALLKGECRAKTSHFDVCSYFLSRSGEGKFKSSKESIKWSTHNNPPLALTITSNDHVALLRRPLGPPSEPVEECRHSTVVHLLPLTNGRFDCLREGKCRPTTIEQQVCPHLLLILKT